ncbi:hypothetical protein B7494_g4950 [Chlorociboria aeruginascens]|nr:hypothetical protein B7494_g4950 [Chlorociboria aeruginascens]
MITDKPQKSGYRHPNNQPSSTSIGRPQILQSNTVTPSASNSPPTPPAIRALIITWNLGTDCAPHQVQDKFFTRLVSGAGSPDILVFNFQEIIKLNIIWEKGSNEKIKEKAYAWATSLQRIFIKDYVSPVKDDTFHGGLFTFILVNRNSTERVKPFPNNAVHYVSCGVDGMPQEVEKALKIEKTSSQPTSAYLTAQEVMGSGYNKKKGGLITLLAVDDRLLVIINCHLDSNHSKRDPGVDEDEDAQQQIPLPKTLQSMPLFEGQPPKSQGVNNEIKRSANANRILNRADQAAKYLQEINPRLKSIDYILGGDTNSRLKIDYKYRDAVVDILPPKSRNAPRFYQWLLKRDELHGHMMEHSSSIFRRMEFKEAQITFAPTYKYDSGNHNKYDEDPKKRRFPAYTDRILIAGNIRTKKGTYNWCNNNVSDHKLLKVELEFL